MASDMNEHISAAERARWNQVVNDMANHLGGASGIHVPSPLWAGNYYLGSDLQWHQIPIANVNIS